MSPTYNAEDAVFRVMHTAKGFQLYHPQQKCYLATTFRSFPNYVGINDTMLHEVHLELEVACVQQANSRASTLYIVDGYQDLILDQSESLLQPLEYHLKRGAAVIESMRRLATFRKLHHYLQDTPDELLHKPCRESEVSTPLLTVVIPVLLIIALCLFRQRTGKSLEFWSSRRGQQLCLLFALFMMHTVDGSCSSQCSKCLTLCVFAALC
ncbi:uncharacterized protein RCC_10100 [Ramularia collo-cygni]|uniref:Uncharacterized protein n=1 Tax=Ramularia collo-cygni TaxID=112498 RepID=A0A2D3VEV7_9PEZI|nr:uncharacterized protein RCC_10100 [Ramularia collo-cygni]CZT24375.1 uncharacterized protein RCC_10100 [Ramularia collo-cygni]